MAMFNVLFESEEYAVEIICKDEAQLKADIILPKVKEQGRPAKWVSMPRIAHQPAR